MGDQIGLLRHYFHERLAAVAPPGSLPAPPLLPPGPQLGLPPLAGAPPPPPPLAPSPFGESTRVITLPDDSPTPAQAKLGPLGQVLKTGAAANAVKKKNKAKEPVSMSGPMGMGDAVPMEPMRAFNGLGADGRNVGVAGAGTDGGGTSGQGVAGGGKKKPGPQGKAVELPPVIAASA